MDDVDEVKQGRGNVVAMDLVQVALAVVIDAGFTGEEFAQKRGAALGP